MGKSKKQVKNATVGLPLFFTKFLYGADLPMYFPYRLVPSSISSKNKT
jgi:hypothetical protein